MEAGAYAVEATIEASHWWFVGRRRLFARELARLAIPRDARVLDIGTSTGSNLRMLSDLGFKYVTGVDMSDEAIRFCAGKGLGHVEKGDVCSLPFDNVSFDVVLATDVIEHVDDDDRAMAEIARVLRPGGKVLITVPAFRSLWGLQDEVAFHKRRYRMLPLLGQLKRVGLAPLRRYYFNYILFVPIWLARQLIRIFRVHLDSEGEVNTPVLNRILGAIFLLDTLTAPMLRVPFGVSILVTAEAGANNSGDMSRDVVGLKDDAAKYAIAAGSPERFGYEWGSYAEMRPDYEQQFLRWTPHMSPEDWRGMSFVDAGCGMGRNSYWPMRYGAARCLAIDVDHRSLASARRTLAPYPAAVVRELSIYDLEASGEYDIVFSIGVIHHLEYPDAALRAMVGAVRPGGRLLIWVYGLENNRWIVYTLTPLRKLLFSRLPIGFVHHLSLYPTILLWALLHVSRGGIKYFRLLRRLTFRHLRAIVFDQMLPKIAHYWSRTEVEQLMYRAGLVDIQLSWVNEMSWAASGRRPGEQP